MEVNFDFEPPFKLQKLLKRIPFTTPANRAAFQIIMILSAGYLFAEKQVSIIASLIEPFFMTIIAASFYFPLFYIQAIGNPKKQVNDELIMAMNLTSVSSLLCILQLSYASNQNWSLGFFGDLALLGFFASLVVSPLMALFMRSSIPVSNFFWSRIIKLTLTFKRAIITNRF